VSETTHRDVVETYFRWAALATVFLYTIGYAPIGFGFLFLGNLSLLVWRRQVLWRRSLLDVPMAVFGAILLVSAALSPYRILAFEVTLMLILSAAVYFGSFGWLLERDPALRTTLFRTWGLGGVAGAFAGLAYSATNYVKALPAGTFEHARAQIPRGVGPNGLGTTLLLGSILALGFAFRARRWQRAAWGLSAVVGLAGLLSTGSRASLGGWLVAAVYLAYRELHLRPKQLAVVLAGGFAVVALAIVGTPQLLNRLPTTLSDVSGNRVQIWRTSLRMIEAHPALGTGFGTFETEYAQYKDPAMSPEPFAFNLGLNLAVETGLIGLLAALFVAFAALHIWRSTSARAAPCAEPLRAVICALWLGLLVNQLADNTLFSISTSAGLWFLLAATVSWPEPVPHLGAQPTEAQPSEHVRRPVVASID
jgi:O-antigen ligase